MSDQERQNNKARLERLQTVLEAYGVDRSRWPEPDRLEFTDADISGEAVARETADARALDVLLAHAGTPTPAAGAAARIAARIVDADEDATVVTMQNRKPSAAQSGLASHWPAAGLLAASLVVGILLGQSNIWTDPISGSFLTADAGISELGDLFLGLPFDPATLAEETL